MNSKTKGNTRASSAKPNLGKDASGQVIPVPGSNAVPAPNIVQPDGNANGEETARIAACAAAILAALERDAALELDLSARKAAGQAATWGAVLTEVASVALDETLGTLKHRGALVTDMLDRVKAAGLSAGPGPLKARTSQYAADLSKAARAMKADKTVPAELWTGSRSTWNEAPFWADVGAKSTRGRKAAGKPGKAGETESVGAVAVAVNEADDVRELIDALAPLRGDFRAEAIRECLNIARGIAARQHQASGGSR
jgi:hypothetical protein